MTSSIRIVAGATITHDRCVTAPLLALLNGEMARSRCIGMDHATFMVEALDTFDHGQSVFARLGGATVPGCVERIDHRAHTITVRWSQDAGTRQRVEGLLRSVVCGRFNPVRAAA